MRLSLFANNFELVLDGVSQILIGTPLASFTNNNCDAVISLEPGKLYCTYQSQEFFIRHTQGAFHLIKSEAFVFCGKFISQARSSAKSTSDEDDSRKDIKCITSLANKVINK